MMVKIMMQASSNISHSPSRIELLWKRHQAAASDKARIYALVEVAAAGSGAPGDVAFEAAEAAADAAYDALEDVVDEILGSETTSLTDFAIKARVLGTRGVEGIGSYRPEAIIQFLADVQTFAARMEECAGLSETSVATLAEAEQALIDRGFRLVPETCDWLHASGLIDAGICPIEGHEKGFRIETKPRRGALI
jgi:hypothetical protein